MRFISNRSSGKMGYALARSRSRARRARDPGFRPRAACRSRDGVQVIHVRTAVEMRDAVMEHLAEATIVVKAAAVADYHLSHVPAAQDQEDRHAHVAGARSHARHPGRAGTARRATAC